MFTKLLIHIMEYQLCKHYRKNRQDKEKSSEINWFSAVYKLYFVQHSKNVINFRQDELQSIYKFNINLNINFGEDTCRDCSLSYPETAILST
jgi:hypothetical protein